MKSWKKRWQDELDAMTPALCEHVKSEPIPAPDRATIVRFNETTPWYKQLFSSPKRIASCLSACAIGLVAVGASVFLLKPDAPAAVAEAEVISVEVNPQAVFTVDKYGKVTSVVAVNEDADVVLAKGRYLEMEGKSVEIAVELFVDYTAQLGYLDLNTPNAVRVSSCAENGYLDEVGDALEGYFQGKGAYIAVAEEVMELPSFCARIQMDVAETVEALKSSVERIPALLFEREAEGITDGEAEALYRENVPVDGMREIFRSAVAKGVQKIEDFEAIDELADKISAHEDNPGLLFKDYWSVKERDYPDTMSALMSEMEVKLLAYEGNYGMRMCDTLDLAAERAKCAVTTVQTLAAYLVDSSFDVFGDGLAAVSDILQGLGIDTSYLERLLDIPETVEEYLVKVNEYAKEHFDSLRNAHREAYKAARERIGEAEYASYIQGLIEEYGSLSDYYNNK